MLKNLFRKKEKILINPELRKFLWWNGALKKFKRNIRNDTVPYGKMYIHHSIWVSFLWDKTPEGEEYWKYFADKFDAKFLKKES